VVNLKKPMNLNKIVSEIFCTIAEKYKMFIETKGENTIEIYNSKCIISIDVYFGEVFISIKENRTDKIGINPFLWGIINEKINYENITLINYDENTTLNKIVISELHKEFTFISLFCKSLLEGDFSGKKSYLEKVETLRVDMNEFYELKNKN
jgi:hypothetical protein